MKTRSLATLLTGLVASVAPLSAACGASAPTVLPASIDCAAVSGAARYDAVTLSPSLDGIVFASIAIEPSATSEAKPATRVRTVGTLCKTATNQEACNQKVRDALATPPSLTWYIEPRYDTAGTAISGSRDFAVITSGDAVRVISDSKQLGAAVAPIDTLAEAYVVAIAYGSGAKCGAGQGAIESGSYKLRSEASSCSGYAAETFYRVNRDGSLAKLETNVLSQATSNCTEGRRPAAYEGAASPLWLVALGEHLSEVAHMEAAAVWAFDELHADLVRHGAPVHFLNRVAQARADEVQHARVMALRVRAHGGTLREMTAPAPRALSLFELALLNATEGCVRETYGALVAAHQGKYARSPELRAAFTYIARDEAEHAQLSLELGEWLEAQLSEAERMQIAQAKADAFDALLAECAGLVVGEEVAREAGMPRAEAAVAMVLGLRDGMALLAA
jgi:hypothetical protein